MGEHKVRMSARLFGASASSSEPGTRAEGAGPQGFGRSKSSGNAQQQAATATTAATRISTRLFGKEPNQQSGAAAGGHGNDAAAEPAQNRPPMARSKSTSGVRKSMRRLVTKDKSKSTPEDDNDASRTPTMPRAYTAGASETHAASGGGIRASMRLLGLGSRADSTAAAPKPSGAGGGEYGASSSAQGMRPRAQSAPNTAGVRASLRHMFVPASAMNAAAPAPAADAFTEEFCVPLNDAQNAAKRRTEVEASRDRVLMTGLVNRNAAPTENPNPLNEVDSQSLGNAGFDYFKDRDRQRAPQTRPSGRLLSRSGSATTKSGRLNKMGSESEAKTDSDAAELTASEDRSSSSTPAGVGTRLSMRFGSFRSGSAASTPSAVAPEKEEHVRARSFTMDRANSASSGSGVRQSMTRLLNKSNDLSQQNSAKKRSPGLSRSTSGGTSLAANSRPLVENAASNKHSKQFYALKAKKAAAFAAPAMMFAPYGALGVGMDLLAIPHNAIRNELKDVYYALSVLDRMFTNITSEDVDVFVEFWEVSAAFIRAYMQYEIDEFFPALDGLRVDLKNTPMELVWRGTQAQKATEALDAMDDLIDDTLAYMAPLEKATALRRHAAKVTAKLLDYFLMQEKTLPKLISARFSLKDAQKLETIMFSVILESNAEYAFAFAHMLVRWTSGPQRDFLVKRHFKKRARAFINWGKEFDARHLQLLRHLNERSKALIEEMDLDADFEAEMVPTQYLLEAKEREKEGTNGDQNDEEDELEDGDLVEIENADGTTKFVRYVKGAPKGEEFVDVDMNEMNLKLGAVDPATQPDPQDNDSDEDVDVRTQNERNPSALNA